MRYKDPDRVAVTRWSKPRYVKLLCRTCGEKKLVPENFKVSKDGSVLACLDCRKGGSLKAGLSLRLRSEKARIDREKKRNPLGLRMVALIERKIALEERAAAMNKGSG